MNLTFQHLESSSGPHPPLFQSHGDADTLVLHQWGKDTYERLRGYGIEGSFLSLPGVDHEMTQETLQELVTWINKILPE